MVKMRRFFPDFRRGRRGWTDSLGALARAGATVCLGALTIAGVGAIPALSAGATAAASVKCPLKSSSSIPAGDAWAFHDSAAPSSPHPGIRSSYVHGRGGWGAGRGSGTICLQNSASGGGSHEVVLAVAGAAHVSAGVTQLGLPGVQLTLHVSVAASDDPSCPVGVHGGATLFASYHEQHRDSLKLRFGGACAPYGDTFAGPQLFALIAENGRQVN